MDKEKFVNKAIELHKELGDIRQQASELNMMLSPKKKAELVDKGLDKAFEISSIQLVLLKQLVKESNNATTT